MKLRRRAALGFAAACVVVAAILAGTLSTVTARGPVLLHTEPSEFAPVLVFEEYGQRCMNFESMESPGRQTCYDLGNPDKMVFAYTRMMTSALFVKPDPQRILFIGLGGGTLPRAFAAIAPGATIDTVEIDPAVVRVAEQYFGYTRGPRQRVFIEDGRAYVERAHRDGVQYDMVMLDAFDVDYIPAHLMTREFLAHVRAILKSDGVLVANSFARSRVYDEESVTYAAVFGEFFNLRSRIEGNRVIIASPAPLPGESTLRKNAAALAPTLGRFGIDTNEALERFSRARDWDADARVLTD